MSAKENSFPTPAIGLFRPSDSTKNDSICDRCECDIEHSRPKFNSRKRRQFSTLDVVGRACRRANILLHGMTSRALADTRGLTHASLPGSPASGPKARTELQLFAPALNPGAQVHDAQSKDRVAALCPSTQPRRPSARRTPWLVRALRAPQVHGACRLQSSWEVPTSAARRLTNSEESYASRLGPYAEPPWTPSALRALRPWPDLQAPSQMDSDSD